MDISMLEFGMIRNRLDIGQINALNSAKWLFLFVMIVLISGCAAQSKMRSGALAISDTDRGDPGRVDINIGVMNAIKSPKVKRSINLDRVTNTIYKALENSNSFKKVTIGDQNADYIVTPTIVAIRDMFDNVVHLRFQTKNTNTLRTVYDHKFVGWNFTQSASLMNISDLITKDLPTIRAAIYTDMHKDTYASKSKKQIKPVYTEKVGTVTLPANDTTVLNLSNKPAKSLINIQSIPQKEDVRWVVIIGISNYSDSRIPSLRYAERDATSLYSWFISPNGGRYAPSRVKLLVGKDASLIGIKTTLFSWLQKALPEDLVTIYFAGHGAPASPDSPENLFLLPYDCDYNNIAATAFPMWDVETALKRFIRAKKVVVIADACHSGGIGQSYDVARRANRGIKINPISSSIQNLSQISNGICVISASSDSQFSQESQKWGGGHGVFTYFLLKGLNGDADYNSDNSVTLGELTSYLSEQVRRETNNMQTPTVAGRYDPALSIGK
jgi:hypothetical protein